MPQNRPNQAQTPINADTFDLTGDLAKMADSLQVVVTVADEAAGDVIAAARAAAGFAVTDARPLICWDQSQNSIIVKGTSGWRGGIKPFGHMGKANGFTSGGDQNPVSGMAGQILRGGMTFSSGDQALVVPIAGYYRVTIKLYTSGAGMGSALANAMLNGASMGVAAWWNKQLVDEIGHASQVRQLAAGDKIALRAQQPASVFGSNGYDGSYVEVEYLDQW